MTATELAQTISHSRPAVSPERWAGQKADDATATVTLFATGIAWCVIPLAAA